MGRNGSKNWVTFNQYCCLIASDLLSSADKFSVWCCHRAPLTAPLRMMKHQRASMTLWGLFTCASACWSCGKRVSLYLRAGLHSWICHALVPWTHASFPLCSWTMRFTKCQMLSKCTWECTFLVNTKNLCGESSFSRLLSSKPLSIFHFLFIVSFLTDVSSLFAVHSKACAAACKFKVLLTPA